MPDSVLLIRDGSTRGVWGACPLHPQLGFKPKWGGGGGGGGGCSVVENKLQNEVKIQKFTTQNFAPAAINKYLYIPKLGQNRYIWENKEYPIPNTSIYNIYIGVCHASAHRKHIVHAAQVTSELLDPSLL